VESRNKPLEILRCPKCWERTATVKKKPLRQSFKGFDGMSAPDASSADDLLGALLLLITVLWFVLGVPVLLVMWLFQRNRQLYGVCKSCRHQWRLG
jgi:hypothetical protein